MVRLLYCHPLLSAASLAIGLVSGILGIYAYFKKHVKRLSYYTLTFDVIGKINFSKLTVLYDNKKIDHLKVTHAYFWNSGNQVLDSSDTVALSPIEIEIEDGKLLEAFIQKTSTKDNNWVISVANSKTKLNFDYIRSHEGCLINIIHTGGKIKVAGS